MKTVRPKNLSSDVYHCFVFMKSLFPAHRIAVPTFVCIVTTLTALLAGSVHFTL